MENQLSRLIVCPVSALTEFMVWQETQENGVITEAALWENHIFWAEVGMTRSILLMIPESNLRLTGQLGMDFDARAYSSDDTTFTSLSGNIEREFRDYSTERPVDDRTFNLFLRQFDYHKLPLNASTIEIEDHGNWKVEKVTIDAAYNNERFDIWLFLPKDVQPPYQPVLLYYGSNVIYYDAFNVNYVRSLEFIVKSGRALVFPVLKGTCERRDGLNTDYQQPTVFYKDHVLMWRKDFGRTIDYLETRSDILSNNIGFFGWSWGGFMGGVLPAVESRIKAVVLHVGGMQMTRALPEVER